MTIALAVLLAFTFAMAAAIAQSGAGLDPATSGLWMRVLLSVTAFHLLLRTANQAARLFRRPAPDIPLAPQGLPFELVHSHDPLPALQSRMEAVLGNSGPLKVMQGATDVPRTDAARPRTDAFAERRGMGGDRSPAHVSWSAPGDGRVAVELSGRLARN